MSAPGRIFGFQIPCETDQEYVSSQQMPVILIDGAACTLQELISLGVFFLHL